jgi:integrase
MLQTTMNPVPVATDDGRTIESRRGRQTRMLLTNRLCERRVEERTKFYDSKVDGLYVSITTSGVATFFLQAHDPFAGKSRCLRLQTYVRDLFTVDDARAASYAVRVRLARGEDVFGQDRRGKTLKVQQGKTVSELAELRIAFMQKLERKEDGEMRPIIESWRNVASHLRRLVVPTLGKRLAADVTPSDVATRLNAIMTGTHGGKPSIANARHARRAIGGLYRWAREPGRDYVPPSCDPTANLPELPHEHPRSRVLSADEIKILWHGLDRADMPWDRRTRLGLKLCLVTMLRSWELLGMRCSELVDLNGTHPRADIPTVRVKRRRPIQQPLSSLAVELIKKAIADDKQTFVFAGRFGGDSPLERKSMSAALRGSKNRDGSVRTAGICDLLGLKPFTPHDLRRTSATLAGDLGFSDGAIAKCLDHMTKRDENGVRLPSVTGKVYNLSRRLTEKRMVLEGIAAAVREIVEDAEPAAQDIKTAA